MTVDDEIYDGLVRDAMKWRHQSIAADRAVAEGSSPSQGLQKGPQQATGEPSTWPDYTPEFRSLTAAEQSSLRNLYRKLYKPVVAQQPTDGALREKVYDAVSNFCQHGGEPDANGDCPTCYKITDEVLERALAAQASSDPLDTPRRG